MFAKAWNRLCNLLFPRRCAICDAPTKGEGSICEICIKKIKPLREPACMKCGKKVKEEETFCYDCSRRPHEFERGFSLFEYEWIRESLYRFKYAGRAEYARFYADMAVCLHGDAIRRISADAFIPVPLHPRRFRKRGYNQAAEFAKALSERTGIPTYSGLVKRIKNTKPLRSLNRKERQNNLKRSFLIRQNDVKLKTIILIDDIYTTGATIDAVARVCKEAGVEHIFFLTVAVGSGI